MPETDDWGGVAVAPAPEQDDWGGVAVKAAPEKDDWGGIAVASKPESRSEDLSRFLTKADPNALSPFVGEPYALDNPAIKSKEDFVRAYNDPLVSLPKPEGTGILAGIGRSVATTSEGLTSPMNLALMGTIVGAPKVIQKIASAGFAAYMGSHLPAAKEAIGAANTPGEKAEAITDFVLGAGMTIAAANHGLGSRADVDKKLRKGGMTQEQIDRISTQIALNDLAPETPYASDQRGPVHDDVVDGLNFAKQKLLTGFADATPEVQKQRQALIDTLDDQLLKVPREQVNASAERTKPQAQSTPPKAGETTAIEAARPPAENNGTSELFKIAKAEAESLPEAATQLTPETAKAVAEVRPETTAEAPVATSDGAAPALDTEPVEATAAAEPTSASEAEAPADTRDEAHLNAYKRAEEVADTVAKGQPDSVREAAFNAAYDSARASIEADPQFRFNPEFMRKAAMSAAGKSAKEMGISLEESGHDQTPSEAPSPDVETSRGEYAAKAQEILGGLNPREQELLRRVTMDGDSLQKVADDLGISKQAVQQAHARALTKLQAQMEAAGYKGGPGAMGPVEALQMQENLGVTGIRNAVVDAERIKRGLEPRVAPIRRQFGEIWDHAMRAFDRNPDVGRDLVNSLQKKVRPLTDIEDAILTHEQLMRHEAFDEAVENVNKAENPAELAEAQSGLDKAREDAHQIYDVGTKAGTANARGLNARKLMVREDYSLSKMEFRKRAESGGKPLTETQLSEVKAAHDRIAELEKRVSESDAALSEAAGHEEMARIYEAEIRDIQKEAAKRPNIPKIILDKARSIVDGLNKRADVARARLSDRLSRLSAGVDPGIVLDVAEIMAAHIGEIGLKSAEVSARVLEEFGDKVKPFLKEAWKKAKQLIDEIDGSKAPPAVKEVLRKTGIGKKEETPRDVKVKLKADAKAGDELSQRYVADLVRAHIKAGVHGEDAVMKAVHKDVQEAYPDATERDVRRAYTEYGKVKFPSKEAVATEMRELRTLTRLQESIDRETEGLDSLHTGLQRDKATQAIREKQAKLNELLKKRQGPPSPEKLASRDEARQTALRNSIDDLDKQLRTGDKPVKGEPISDSTATEQLRSERDAMREKLREIEGEAKRTPEEIYNATQATRIKKRLEELKDKNARGDYTLPPKRVPPKLSAENARDKAELEREKQKFEAGVAKDRANNRTTSQKFWDRFVGIERALKLSSDVVLGKLTTAALAREFALTPAEELAGGALSKALPKLAARAPREGGVSLAAEIKAKREMFTSGMRDAWDNLRMRKSDLEVTQGNRRPQAPPEWYEYFGFLHGALKAPIKRAEFARSLEKRMLAATREGIDLSNPETMRRLAQESYVDANRAIFMQDNVVANAFSIALRSAENSKTSPLLGPAVARIGRFLVPIVKVPTNIVGEVATGVHGTVSGSIRAAHAYMKGIDSLPPEQADAIMRQLKKGLIGNALLLTGYFGYKSIGGFYHDKDKRSDRDVQPNYFRVGGLDLPSFVSHSNGAMLLNIGATLHRVEEERGVPQGVLVAGSGLAKELPMIPAVTGVVSALETEDGFKKYLNQLVTSSTTPALTQHIAKVIDTPGSFPKNAFQAPNRRAPSNPIEAVEMGIPGLRQNVPQKKAKHH